MKITVGRLRALIQEAARRDSRMSGGKVLKDLSADPVDPAAMRINLLKRDIAFMKGRIKKKLMAGDRANEVPEMKAYLSQLEAELTSLQNVNEADDKKPSAPTENCPECGSRCKSRGKSGDGYGEEYRCQCGHGWES